MIAYILLIIFGKLELEAKAIFLDCDLQVPAKSQMEEASEKRTQICSPVNLAMLLEYFGTPVDISAISTLAFDEHTKTYGVWPANIKAASYYNLIGYPRLFADWDEVKGFLNKGMPLIASLSYEQGELTDAAYHNPNTHFTGHLVTICGVRNEKVLVNDPAASERELVSREYDLREFTKVWLKRNSMAYVLQTL